MPPKVRITREMVIDAGFETVRSKGENALNVRSIAAKLGCSTQPVLYCFKNMDALKKEVAERAGEFHSEYLMKGCEDKEEPMLDIGLNYIRFAKEEPFLFRFLFQSGVYSGGLLRELIFQCPESVMQSLQAEAHITRQQAEDAFAMLFIGVHGFASLLANNSMDFDEEYCARILTKLFNGMLNTVDGETEN